ncbi:NAD(P)-dependent oxidoreductase [Streptomyces sp. DSM 3412]|uniref:NAD(P)-dependent oxidoreductase n=1 Tax=Streptomyces gottesmaniae TaxID=3075518 RepID=A0ABU2YQX9_9ACTN|nr:NAD(P)-dependent oxidoreductase [Streptomyces sp. DSM 3412]MDT0566726.1 NAD(P)-dependent oxidoreductase [Streptomyces sp. DSM 3412]
MTPVPSVEGGQGRVVVLGGTGFVGRRVCADFRATGWEVTAVARRAPAEPDGTRFLPLDLTETPAGALADLLDAQRPDVVVNATGSIWSRDDAAMERICTLPTLRLLKAADSMSRRPRLVHLGSVLEYGPIPPGATVGARWAPEPTSAYGKAKLAASRAVLEAVARGSVDGLVLRVANVAGVGTPDVSLLGRVAARLLHGAAGAEPVVVELAPLRAHRDYVDVRDVSDAVLAAARSTASGTAVDIGRGEAVPVRRLVDLLVEVSGVPARIVEQPLETGAPTEPDWIRVDLGAARELLGWRPRRSLEESVRSYWRDVRDRAV